MPASRLYWLRWAVPFVILLAFHAIRPAYYSNNPGNEIILLKWLAIATPMWFGGLYLSADAALHATSRIARIGAAVLLCGYLLSPLAWDYVVGLIRFLAR